MPACCSTTGKTQLQVLLQAVRRRGWSRTMWQKPMSVCLSNKALKCNDRARFLCARREWITEWLTFASVAMLWKSYAEKFFFNRLLVIRSEKIGLCTCAIFFQWGEFTISIGGTLQPTYLPLAFVSL